FTVLEIRQKELALRRARPIVLFCIPDDPDYREPGRTLLRILHADTFADRILPWPVLIRQSAIDDHHPRALQCVGLGYVSTASKGHPHRSEIAGQHYAVNGVRPFARQRQRLTLDPKRPTPGIACKGQVIYGGSRFDPGNGPDIPQHLLVELRTLIRPGLLLARYPNYHSHQVVRIKSWLG